MHPDMVSGAHSVTWLGSELQLEPARDIDTVPVLRMHLHFCHRGAERCAAPARLTSMQVFSDLPKHGRGAEHTSSRVPSSPTQLCLLHLCAPARGVHALWWRWHVSVPACVSCALRGCRSRCKSKCTERGKCGKQAQKRFSWSRACGLAAGCSYGQIAVCLASGCSVLWAVKPA